MDLQAILNELPEEARLGFLQKAYRPEQREIADALMAHLAAARRVQDLEKVLVKQIAEAKKTGESERQKKLHLQFICALNQEGIERLAKEANDSEIYERVIENCRKDYWRMWEVGVNLLEHLGRTKEAKTFALETARVLDKRRRKSLDAGGKWANHGIDRIYRRFGMHREEVEVRLDNRDFGEAIRLAQEHLSEEELPNIYTRVYAAAEGLGYNHGFPEQIKAAVLLKDGKLLRETKEKYLKWILSDSDHPDELKRYCPLDLIREIGTPEQLRAEHDRRIRFHTENGLPTNLVRAAEEAYKDLGDKKYAEMVMKSYEQLGDFPKALEYARLVDEKKAAVLQEAVNLL